MALPQDSYAPYTGIDGSTSFTPLDDQVDSNNTPGETPGVPPNTPTWGTADNGEYDKYAPGWKGDGTGVTADQSKPSPYPPETTENSSFDKYAPGWKGDGTGVTADQSKPSPYPPETTEDSSFDKYAPGWKGDGKGVMTGSSGTERNQDSQPQKGQQQKQKNDSKEPAAPQKNETDNKPTTGNKLSTGTHENTPFKKNKDVDKNNEEKTNKANDNQGKDKKKDSGSKDSNTTGEKKSDDGDKVSPARIPPTKIEPSGPAPTTVESDNKIDAFCTPNKNPKPQEIVRPEPIQSDNAQPPKEIKPADNVSVTELADKKLKAEAEEAAKALEEAGKNGDPNAEKGFGECMKDFYNTTTENYGKSMAVGLDSLLGKSNGYGNTGQESVRLGRGLSNLPPEIIAACAMGGPVGQAALHALAFCTDSFDYEAIQNEVMAKCKHLDMSIFTKKKSHTTTGIPVCTENAIVKCAMGSIFSKMHLTFEKRPVIGTVFKNRMLLQTDFVPGMNFDGFGPCWNILNPAVAAATLAASLAAGTFILTPVPCQATMLPTPWIPTQYTTMDVSSGIPQLALRQDCVCTCWGIGAIQFVHCGQDQPPGAPGFSKGVDLNGNSLGIDGEAIFGLALNILGTGAGAIAGFAGKTAQGANALRAMESLRAATAFERSLMATRSMKALSLAKEFGRSFAGLNTLNKGTKLQKIAWGMEALSDAGTFGQGAYNYWKGDKASGIIGMATPLAGRTISGVTDVAPEAINRNKWFKRREQNVINGAKEELKTQQEKDAFEEFLNSQVFKDSRVADADAARFKHLVNDGGMSVDQAVNQIGKENKQKGIINDINAKNGGDINTAVNNAKEMRDLAKEYEQKGGHTAVMNAKEWSGNVKKFHDEGGQTKLDEITKLKADQKNYKKMGGDSAWEAANNKKNAANHFEQNGGTDTWTQLKEAKKYDEMGGVAKQKEYASAMMDNKAAYKKFEELGGEAELLRLAKKSPLSNEEMAKFEALVNNRNGHNDYIKAKNDFDIIDAQRQKAKPAIEDPNWKNNYDQMQADVNTMGGEKHIDDASRQKMKNDFTTIDDAKNDANHIIRDGNGNPVQDVNKYEKDLNNAKNGRGDYANDTPESASAKYQELQDREDTLTANNGSASYSDREDEYNRLVGQQNAANDAQAWLDEHNTDNWLFGSDAGPNSPPISHGDELNGFDGWGFVNDGVKPHAMTATGIFAGGAAGDYDANHNQKKDDDIEDQFNDYLKV